MTPATILATVVMRQREWSLTTFGDGLHTESLLSHIAKECDEIRESPRDAEEWIDIALLALDGAWRTGLAPANVARLLLNKQAKNRKRTWVIPSDPNLPIEHSRD